jgi:GNAT superfamily N-acetyltransferase
MALHIAPERPDTEDAKALIRELDAHLIPLYPSESRHGYPIEKLILEGVSFFVMRYNEELAGCGALKLFPGEYAEVKRMYVRPQFRGKGFGKMMLDHLAAFAREQGILLLRLETGIHQPEAMGLYERMGFQRIGPFGDYVDDPLSLFYEKHIP